MSAIKPLFDRLVIEAVEIPKTSAAGIVLQSTTTLERPGEGTVVAQGIGKRTADGTILPWNVHVGDRVAFNPNSAHQVKANGKAYWMLREDDVIAIIE
jgi:chaperonin GroES